MRILPNIPGISSVYNNKARVTQTAGAKEVAGKRDELTLSPQAKDFATVMNALKSVPDVRADKVAHFSKAIESDTYQVSDLEIADKLMQAFSARRI